MIRSNPISFAHRVRDHQISWVQNCGQLYDISNDMLEVRRGKTSWVLRKEHKERNLFRREWWKKYLAGKEHRWARALNSSQCFAINLFGPLADEPELARRIWQQLQPQRRIESADKVRVHFEHSIPPARARARFGESGQPTQIDVVFSAHGAAGDLGHLLVEVKLTESGFGRCRGVGAQTLRREGNPDPSRCDRLEEILAAPSSVCWLAEKQGRLYWERMREPGSSIDLSTLPRNHPCPFKSGLYQLMRNRLLADEMAASNQAAWADVAVCAHPENDRVRYLEESFDQTNDIIAAFDSITPKTRLLIIDPKALIRDIAESGDSWHAWRLYMSERYRL